MNHCWADYNEEEHGGMFTDSWLVEYEKMLEAYPAKCYQADFVGDCDGSCVQALDAMDKTCMLEDGHDGPHEWTLSSEIIIEFVDELKQ